MLDMDGDDEPFEGFDDGGAEKQYIYMELTSTANFRDIDIDAMLEQTTMEDFMRGLKKKGYDGQKVTVAQASEDVVTSILRGEMPGLQEKEQMEANERKRRLVFDEEEETDEEMYGADGTSS